MGEGIREASWERNSAVIERVEGKPNKNKEQRGGVNIK